MAPTDEPPKAGRGEDRSLRVCHLSRRHGWIDPDRPHRPTSEMNLLAVYLNAPVWTLETAWAAVFRSLMPPRIERAYRHATAGLALSEDEIESLRSVAERLGVRLEVHD